MRYGNPSKKTRVVSSTKGHSIEFPGRGTLERDQIPAKAIMDEDKVVYVHVPSVMAEEVAMAGMQPESEIEEKDETAKPRKPEDKGELRKQVYETFKLLVEAGERDSFNANGVPKGQAVEKLLGYTLHNTEVKELWQQFMIDSRDGGAS